MFIDIVCSLCVNTSNTSNHNLLYILTVIGVTSFDPEVEQTCIQQEVQRPQGADLTKHVAPINIIPLICKSFVYNYESP